MPRKNNKILLLYTDKYYLIKQVYPYGLDIIVNHLHQYGYEVTIDYPFLADDDLEINIASIIKRTHPDIIGLGLRNIDTTMSCEQYGNYEGPGYKTFYFLADVKKIVETVRKIAPHVPMIAGGGAFSISPVTILETLGLQYGIVGEGEEPLREFVEAFPDKKKISGISNLVWQTENGFKVNSRRPYVFKESERIFRRDRKFNYAYETAGLPLQIKRGCNQNCSYCIEPLIEGNVFSFKNHEHVIRELKSIAENYDGVRNIFFTDTEFNIPTLEYCSKLVKKILTAGLHEYFRFSSQFLPKPFDAEFARLLSEAGFCIILTCDSFADRILEINRTAYRQKDITHSLELCEKFSIDCTTNLIFGLPGESYETIDCTLQMVSNNYPSNALRRYEYTIGGRIYPGTPLCHFVENNKDSTNLYGKKSPGYLEPYFYCAPESPLELKAYIEQNAHLRMDYQNRYDRIARQRLAITYLTDQCKWNEASSRFFSSELTIQMTIYDYLIRKLSESGMQQLATSICNYLLKSILQSGQSSLYREQAAIIRYYLALLEATS